MLTARTQDMLRRLAERDYRAMLTRSDARKAENAASRARCRANGALVALLTVEAARRGQPGIDWAEYFRSLGVQE